jgi:hypothetical protein
LTNLLFVAKVAALTEAEPEFRAFLDTWRSLVVLVALCKEPTMEIYSRPYLQQRGSIRTGL